MFAPIYLEKRYAGNNKRHNVSFANLNFSYHCDWLKCCSHSSCLLFLVIANHMFTIVGDDAFCLKSFTTSLIMLGPRQTMYVLIDYLADIIRQPELIKVHKMHHLIAVHPGLEAC